MRQLVLISFFTNIYASFHLWWQENLLNHQNVSNYFEHDCLQDFRLLFMSLLTALIIKDSHILARVYFIFLKKCHGPNLNGFQYQILDLSEKIEKIVIK